MSQSSEGKQVASPFSTGGGGSEYEDFVGGYYLAMMLLQVVPRGQGTAVIDREVQFQSLYRGEPVDDIVVRFSLPQREIKLAIQCKRDLTFGVKDQQFDDVIHACWDTFTESSFSRGFDRFGIALGLYSKNIDEYYKTTLTWARTSTTAEDFLKRLSQKGLGNQSQSQFVDLIRTKLDNYAGRKVSDEDLWQFLRSMVLLHFDFQQDDSRDQTYTIDLLSYALPAEQKARASDLFQQLVRYAATANRTGGSFDRITLTERLIGDGFSLLPTRDCRQDLERLEEHANFILRDIRADIGGLVLNRTQALTDIQEHLHTATLLELVGAPGVGKSAILKALIEQYKGESPPIVLSWDRLSGIGWNGFAQILQLSQPLHELLLAISGSSSPCVFIDGVDRITDEGARKVVNDLLRSIAELSFTDTGSKRWKVIVSARMENFADLNVWLDWRALGQPDIVQIEKLTEEEFHLIVEHRPHLIPLLSFPHLEPIVRNLFMLRILDDRRMLVGSNGFPSVATEIEVSKAWWERLVGLTESNVELGRARQQALLTFGKQCISHPERRIACEYIAANILLSLESDGILLRDADRDVYRLSHDVLQDWIFFRVLDQHREDFTEYLQEIDEPLGLLRGVQLLGTFLLERQETTTWIQLMQKIEQVSSLAPKWRQALLMAPIRSPQARQLLDQVKPFLLQGHAQLLIELLTLMRTVEVTPDYSLLPIIEKLGEDQVSQLSLLLSRPVPNWLSWLPLIDWFLAQTENWSNEVRVEMARLMELWLQQTPYGWRYRKEIGTLAFRWLEEARGESPMMSYDEKRAFLSRLRKTIFQAADVLPEKVAAYLKEIAAHGSVHAIEEALATYRPLVDHLPKDYVDFALEMLVMNPEEDYGTGDIHHRASSLRFYYDDLGIRERLDCSPPAHIQGPFLYLLGKNEHEGLRLVQSLADTAVAVWLQREQDLYYRSQRRTPLPISITLPTGTHEFWGDERVYYWYRSSLGGQEIVTSALMALEVWLEEQVSAGREPSALFEQILNGSTCIAVVGCCLSAAYAYPERCLQAALPLIHSSVVWRLDMYRVAQDRQPPVYWLPNDYPLIYEARRERDQCPQRTFSLSLLAGHYLFADESLRISFEQALGQFSEHLPFLFKEEQEDPAAVTGIKEWTEQIQAMVNRTNYQTYQQNGQMRAFHNCESSQR
jgi:hypothetical protein